MKKSMKKFMIACAAVSSIAIAAGMSAMAADISANYSADNNSIPVATPDGAADGTQMTVLVVPTDKKAAVTDADILYINQAAKGELPATALLKGESLADGTYSVLVGYYDAAGAFAIAEDTFTIGEAAPEYTLGDVDDNGKINAADASKVISHALKKAILNETQQLAADVDKNEKINAADASKIISFALKKITSF